MSVIVQLIYLLFVLPTVNDTVMSMQSRRSMPVRLEDRFRKTSAAETSISFDEKPKVGRSFSEQGDTPAVMRRRRLAGKAAQIWRKSVSGPDYENTEQHLTAKHVRKILAKTAATNVSIIEYADEIVERF
jgi:hypothetical protein